MEASENLPESNPSEQEQPTFAFATSLSEKYRPKTIAEFVGLEKPKKVLVKFAALPYPSAWLFVGPPGVGKTTMALALAAEIGAELQHIPSQKCTVENVEDTIRRCYYVPLTGGFHLVLCDEADRMTPAAQLALLSKLDATAFPPNTIFVFTCNETGNLEPRFLSRCRVLEFSSYGMAGEIVAYLEKVWAAEGGNGNGPDLARLTKESRNNVRDCLMRLEVELMAL
jgi:replication-associated recombination protein RarA